MTSAAPSRTRGPRARRPFAVRVLAATAAVAAAVAASAGLTGCDLRVETPEPTPLVPDAAEQLRERSAGQAAELASAAQAAAAGAPEAVAAVLGDVATASEQHLAALGGVYDPFPGVTPSPSPTATSTPPPADPATVLTALRTGVDAAVADASAAGDPGMTHLLTSVALDRALLADRLATALGEPAADLPVVTVPAALPDGVDAQAAAVLVQSEDAAGLAWEVVAARSTDDARARAAERAATHRDRAESWAVAAGIDGTGTDPRRPAYDLPDAVTGADVPADLAWSALGEIEAALGEAYAALVPAAAPEDRPVLFDAALEALLRATRLGVDVPVLPGMGATA